MKITMMSTTMKPESLAAIVHESEAAAEAAAKADRPRQRAEAECARADKSYLDKFAAEWPAAREAATTAVGESHAALEQAVRSGDDVFRAYLRWVEASVQA